MKTPTLKQVIHLILTAFPKALIRGHSKHRLLIYHKGRMTVRSIKDTPEGVLLITGGDEFLVTCGDDLLGWIADHRGRIGPVEKDQHAPNMPPQTAIPEVVRLCWTNPSMAGITEFSRITPFQCNAQIGSKDYEIYFFRPGDPNSPWAARLMGTSKSTLTPAQIKQLRDNAKSVLEPIRAAMDRAAVLCEGLSPKRCFIVSPDVYETLQGEKMPLEGVMDVPFKNDSVRIFVDHNLPQGSIREFNTPDYLGDPPEFRWSSTNVR